MNLRFTANDENGRRGLYGSGARWVHGAREGGGDAAVREWFRRANGWAARNHHHKVVAKGEPAEAG